MEDILNRLGQQCAFPIGELSEVGAARRAGNSLAREQGFCEVRTGELALIITEAATNIAKHAERGTILLRTVNYGTAKGVEVIALDQGPGMSNPLLQMVDGTSSTGSYGVGLGAIKRLADQFEIYTGPDLGCALLILLWDSDHGLQQPDWQIGSVCLPLPTEEECGDAWSTASSDHSVTLLVADGLGHGPQAAKASTRAVEVLAAHDDELPSRLLQHCHVALRGSRGAALAIAHIDHQDGEMRYSGIGNIAGSFYVDSKRRHLLSHNGIVGNNMYRVQEFVETWPVGALLIMHSDGLHTKWNLDDYPGLLHAHPSLIAAVLYRDFVRGRDDSTVVVLRDARVH